MSLTAAERIEAAQKRRAEKAEAETKAREEQFATDLEAIEALEAELGQRVHHSSQVKAYVPGLPVVVGVRAPDPGEYKRLVQMIARNGNQGDAKVAAVLTLAESCWVYPKEKAVRDAMVAANAGLPASVGNFANTIAEVEIKEEGKG